MALTITWTRNALKNLDEEMEHIQEDDPEAVKIVFSRIEKAIQLLAEQPEIGRPGRVAGTRELVVPKTCFILPYRVKGQRLYILRVFHTSRRWPKEGLPK